MSTATPTAQPFAAYLSSKDGGGGERLCNPCLKINTQFLQYGDDGRIAWHMGKLRHKDLAQLRSCAWASVPCPFCRLLWASIEDRMPPEHVRMLVDSWRRSRDRLFLVMQRVFKDFHFDDGRHNFSLRRVTKHHDTYLAPDLAGVELRFRSAQIQRTSFPLAISGNLQLPTGFADNIAFIRSRLARCIQSHTECGGQAPTLMPRRVVALGEPTLRLVEKHGQYGRYIALSYVWGSSRDAMFKLTTANKLQLEAEIPWAKLPRTHQEAIHIANALGYDFIWIDAVCIIQDDRQDWAQQAPLMSRVYGNADLTLVAARSNDSSVGFFSYPDKRSCPSSTVWVQWPGQPGPAECSAGKMRSRTIGPILDRGWCFQESIMSRREISYGEEQIRFSCSVGMSFEDGQWAVDSNQHWFDVARIFNDYPSSPWWKHIASDWGNVIARFSNRSFFDPRDNHAALSGIVLRYQDALERSLAREQGGNGARYTAGLWEANMVRGLLWKSGRLQDPDLPALVEPVYMGKKVYRAPSWSWMALVGPVLPAERQGYYMAMCKPAHVDGRTWAADPDGWGPLTVDFDNFPIAFKLRVQVYLRELCIYEGEPYSIGGRMPGSCNSGEPSLYSKEALRRHTFLLGPVEEPWAETVPEESTKSSADEAQWPSGDPWNSPPIIAAGLFDMDNAAHSGRRGVLAMAVTSDEGLLLEPVPDGNAWAYRRLGIFLFMPRGQEAFFGRSVKELGPATETPPPDFVELV